MWEYTKMLLCDYTKMMLYRQKIKRPATLFAGLLIY